MSEHRTATAFRMGLREYRRMPLLWVLLVGLPAYLLAGFASLIPDTTVLVDLPSGGQQPLSLVEVYIATFTPLVAGLVAGIAGLFLMRATSDADSRLVIAGYRAREVVLARFGLVVAVGVTVSIVAVAITSLLVFAPEDLPAFVGATLLGAVIWGLLGVLAGLVLDRLGGVYLILFGTMVDMFLFQNPLVADRAAIAPFLPGYAPVRLAVDASFASSADLAPFGVGLAMVSVLTVLAVGAFYQSTRPS
jgi:ABC-2 type transport system permease protein